MSRTELWSEWCARLEACGIDPSRVEIANGRGLEITVTHSGSEAARRVYNPEELVTDAMAVTEYVRTDRRTRQATISIELIRGTFAITLHGGKVTVVTLKAAGVAEERLFAELERLGYREPTALPPAIQRFQERIAVREGLGCSDDPHSGGSGRTWLPAAGAWTDGGSGH